MRLTSTLAWLATITHDCFMNRDGWQELEECLRRLNIHPRDLTEQFVRSGGHGGQNVNKVSSCVILTHKPSGISVRCEEERSQNQNRLLARKRLIDRLEGLARARINARRQAVERLKRQKRQRNRTSKERTLKFKRFRSEIKKTRKSPESDT